MTAALDWAALKAVLLDVDGTLYLQAPLRRRMALGLALYGLSAPREGARAAVLLQRFRVHRERLRDGLYEEASLEALQYETPARAAGVPPEELRALVVDWIERRPLPHLKACGRPGVAAFLEACRGKGLRLGVLSDYPTRAKVEALGLSRYIDLHLCSTDPEINAFKPSPAGLLEACRRWGIEPGQLLYVGDRTDTDGEAARAAGSRFVQVGSGRGRGRTARDFWELAESFNG